MPYTISMKRAAQKSKARKAARMELRVPRATKDFIRHAMAVSGRSAADLAYEGARLVLEEHERVLLTGRNREMFLAAVRNPPKPTERLIRALRHHDALR